MTWTSTSRSAAISPGWVLGVGFLLATLTTACSCGDPFYGNALVLDGWEVDFEVRFPAPVAELESIQVVASESLGTAGCGDKKVDGTDDFHCSWLLHGDYDTLRYVVVERASGTTEVYALGVEYGEAGGAWSEWRRPDFIARSQDVHFALLRGRTLADVSQDIPDGSSQLRFHGKRWPPAPD